MFKKTIQITGLCISLLIASPALARKPINIDDKPLVHPRMEVCFVLDTTGSMSGLIDGAKRKIWYIANQIVQAQPAPDVRFCLIGFRDRGDEYVTRTYDLSHDLDDIYKHLNAFSANGGGDTPESVNQALHEAIRDTSWSRDENVLRTVFLVGDSPPHMDYAQDVKYPAVARMARERDIIINTIQCGSNGDTTPIWKDIARRSHGSYSAIPQSGNVQTIKTPMDQDMVSLNRKLGKTLVPYGAAPERKKVYAKQRASEAASGEVISDRLGYNAKTHRIVQGGGDLIEAIDSGLVKLENIPSTDLPEALKSLSGDEKTAWLDERRNERKEIQQVVDSLIKERDAYIENVRKKQGNRDAFDEEVTRMLREQAARKGIYYE